VKNGELHPGEQLSLTAVMGRLEEPGRQRDGLGSCANSHSSMLPASDRAAGVPTREEHSGSSSSAWRGRSGEGPQATCESALLPGGVACLRG